jgi:threonine aldolase
MSRVVDLRSDTVTLPTPAMREAMAQARVGDDVYAEDPTINQLEALAAEMCGKQAGLFVPSGCMANLIAQLVYVRRGDEVVCGHDSHAVRWETGAGAAFAGVQYAVVPGSGHFVAADIDERFKKPDFHTPGTALVWIENTHNMGGGIVQPLAEIAEIRAYCREKGLSLHLDGARVFNAAVALGEPVRALADQVDSLSFCLSKGLGAPVGSVLVGSAELRAQGHRFRKMLGGGMRQAGIIAAAGIHALEHHVERLADDHARAQRLARVMAETPGLFVDLESVQTNIIMARVESGDAPGLVAACKERGVLFSSLARGWVRLVTHLDIDDEGLDTAIDAIRAALTQ